MKLTAHRRLCCRLAVQAQARVPVPTECAVHCSFGYYPAREYLWQVNSFRGLRAYDIAKLIGVEVTLPGPLVAGLWEEISPNAEERRATGVFPAAVAVPEDAPLLDRLLGLTGRTPSGASIDRGPGLAAPG
jgi:hypothetical protein